MIALLRGTLINRDAAGLVVEAAGVGYFVEVPLGTFERLPAVGQEVTLHTELVVREDSWQLFGFDSPADRLIFRRLLAASGVGARLAMAALSCLGSSRTIRAIRDRDIAALSSVPGIGRKKAERIALELGDRLDDLPLGPDSEPLASPAADATRALVALGYAPAAAETAVRGVTDDLSTGDTALLVRRALTSLNGS